MLLSTKGRYGLKAAYELSILPSGALASLHEISQKQDITPAYCEQLLGLLRKAGLVEGLRGSSGGYRLSRSADAITVGQVLRALEGNLSTVACMDGENCSKSTSCVTRGFWAKLQQGIDHVLDSMTLADMAKDNEMSKENNS